MVSFSCEACGDVLTKKKLDQHRNQCRGASFTCLDCMVHFFGVDYRSHTSCISEAQKYQGHLYRGKEKDNNNSNNNNKRRSWAAPDDHTDGNDDSRAMLPRRAYVEDVPEGGDDSQAIAVIDVPPRAPTPPPAPEPPAALTEDVNVFDFLVAEDTPNAAKTAAAEMRMIDDGPGVGGGGGGGDVNADSQYSQFSNGDGTRFSQYGFSYGNAPVPPSYGRYDSWPDLAGSQLQLQHEQQAMMLEPRYEYVTPGPKEQRRDKRADKSDKKRKRYHIEELDLTTTAKRPLSRDQPMTDAPATLAGGSRVLHSGLTGGLSKLVTDSSFYDDRIDAGPTPISPVKRSRRGGGGGGDDDEEAARKRDRRKSSYTSYSTTTTTRPSSSKPVDPTAASARHPRSRSHDRAASASYHDDRHRVSASYHDDRHRTSRHHHRASRHGDSLSSSSDDNNRTRHTTRSSRPAPPPPPPPPASRRDHSSRPRPPSVQPTAHNQLITYRPSPPAAVVAGPSSSRADHFLALVTKGPDSERGCSVNKVLKRFHRERGVGGSVDGKEAVDKELWKALRLRRNERGEIVVFVD